MRWGIFYAKCDLRRKRLKRILLNNVFYS